MHKRNHFQKLQQKRYSAGTYRNPYFQKKTTTNRSHFIFAGGGVLFCVVFAMIYTFAYPAFAIRSVEIRGLDSSSHTQMEMQLNTYLHTSRFLFFRNTNRFLFSEKTLREFLSHQFAFDTLEIKLQKQTLTLSIKERTSDIIWKTRGNQYLADRQGIITQKIDSPNNTQIQGTSKSLPIFVDRDNAPIDIGGQVLTAQRMNQILAFQQELQNQGIQFVETQIDEQAGKWIGVLTQDGYQILFDPDIDVTVQALRLKTLLHDTIKDTSHLQYVDLRFGDHVYYK